MTSRQFSRPGRKPLRRMRVVRESRALQSAWRNAFLSLCAVALGVYVLSVSLAR